jgi:hypothetical protein
VGNPEGGTNRVWKPGSVDLRVDVAEGETNPKRVAGAAQDSGGDVEVNPEGKSKSKGGSGATASDGESMEDRAAVETAWREPGTRYRLLGS